MKQILETKKSTNYQKNIEILLQSKFCTHPLQVEFALHCAQSVFHLFDAQKFPKEHKQLAACLELVATWLIAPQQVSEKKLNEAANAAYTAEYAAKATADAAYAAAYAAAGAAAYAAANKADDAAAYAARAAAYAAAKAVRAAAKIEKQKELYKWLFAALIKQFNSTTMEVLYGESK
jgi:hypothetical protein